MEREAIMLHCKDPIHILAPLENQFAALTHQRKRRQQRHRERDDVPHGDRMMPPYSRRIAIFATSGRPLPARHTCRPPRWMTPACCCACWRTLARHAYMTD